MDEAVNLSFRYSESDIVHAMRSHYASHMRPRLDIVMAVGLAVAGAYCWRSPSWHWSGVFFATASAVFVLFLFAAFVIMPPLAFRLEPKYRDDYFLTFSPTGLHFRTVHIDSQLQWNLYSRALVDACSYILYYGSRTFTIIPKRVFQNVEQQRAFEELLAQHVPKIVNKKIVGDVATAAAHWLLKSLCENFKRPSGTRFRLPLSPALKRRAIIRRPSGAQISRPLSPRSSEV
jgi:YcxB-like protein